MAFYDNRIEVESLGLLLPGLTVDDFKLGDSQIRNPAIARVFHELDLIEQGGVAFPASSAWPRPKAFLSRVSRKSLGGCGLSCSWSLGKKETV